MAVRRVLASCLVFLIGGVVGPAQAAPTRLERILAAKELRVCIWPDYYGITYRNPRDRTLSGLDIDLSADFAASLGVRVRYIDSSFAVLLDNLLGDRCDIAMHGVGVTPARAEKLQFSAPYLRSDVYAITTKSNTSIKSWDDLDKPGRQIAVQAGTLMEPLMQRSLKQGSLISVKPPATRELEVEAGRADAFMTDYPYSRRLLDTTDWARLIAPSGVFHLTDYAYALPPGDKALLERVNRFLVDIKKDGRLLKLATKYKLESIIVRD